MTELFALATRIDLIVVSTKDFSGKEKKTKNYVRSLVQSLPRCTVVLERHARQQSSLISNLGARDQ